MIKQEKDINKLQNPVEIKKQVKAELGYDSDLVMDSEDEKKLDQMPEL